MKKRPVSAAAAAHPESTPSFLLTCPERGDSASSRLSGLPLQELLGRLAPRETREGGGGWVGGVSGNLGSHRRPLSPSPSRRGSGSTRRAAPTGDESGEGAGGERCGAVEGGGRPYSCTRGAAAASGGRARRSPCRRHRAHGVRALLPSEVPGRGAPGPGQEFAAQASPPLPRKTKGGRGLGREKFSAPLQMDLIETSRPTPRRGGLVGGGQGGAGSQEPRSTIATRCEPIWPPPSARGNSPGPAAPTLAASVLLEDADKICSSPSRNPRLPDPRPGCKVALGEPGSPQTKPVFGNKILTRFPERRGWERAHPPQGAPFLRWSRGSGPCQTTRSSGREAPARSGFPGAGASAPRPSRVLGGLGSPWRASRALRKRSQSGPERTLAAPALSPKRPSDKPRRWPGKELRDSGVGARIVGRGD